MSNNYFLSRKSAKKNIHLPNTKVLKFPSKLQFGTDMFTFNARLRFTHTYKFVNVQKKTFNLKTHDQFIECRNKTSK